MFSEQELSIYGRPMYMDEKPSTIFNALGTRLECKNWDSEAALMMLRNNLHPEVAIDWQNLIVYGGAGRAARNWHEYHRIIKALKNLGSAETLCIQSGKPVYVAPTHKGAPRVIIANSNIVPRWSNQENFDLYDRMGLTMYGQMTAGSWIYIGTQGILQGTYETFAACAKKHFGTDSLQGKLILTAGMGGMSGAQPMAGTMNDGIILDVEVRPERISKKVREGYCDRMTEKLDIALYWIEEAKKLKISLSIGLVGNAADIYPELVRRGVIPDIVTDQTPAHDIWSYIPIGDFKEMEKLKQQNPEEYKKRAYNSIAKHVEAILEMQKRGAIAFDYGNNLRHQAEIGGLKVKDENGQFLYPGFVPAYIRHLFCQGKGPFRWAALSGDSNDIHIIDKALLEIFPEDESLRRWIGKVQKKVPFVGLPTRICWLGYGDRAIFGKKINYLVAKGKIKAPIVIGRDHLDCGSVASPFRETEGMKDGSDAIADWPFLNFALNAINGASWVSFHNGGGVGIGYALHAGMVIVADGTKEREKRLERVLTVDPGIGIARHVDAGYKEALETAKNKKVKIPASGDKMENADLLIVNAAELLTLSNPTRRPKRKEQMKDLGIIKNGALAIKHGLIVDIGETEKIKNSWDARKIIDVRGKTVMPGFIDCHTHLVFGGSREEEFSLKVQGTSYLELLKRGGGILETVKKTRETSFQQLLQESCKKLTKLLEYGATTIEIKSGYGLSTIEEIRILRVIDAIGRMCKFKIIPTFLGAHAFPKEVSRQEYLEKIFGMLNILSKRMVDYCDVFCEKGVFSLEETENIFKHARKSGLKLKLHAGEFNDIGAVELGVKWGATSVDHLDYISDSAIRVLAKSETIGVLLPAVPFHLMTGHYAPARKLIDEGAAIALATDFNPGSAPNFSMQMIITLACRQMKMTAAEAITASTLNAAYAIDQAEKIGSLEIGKEADVIILDIANHLQLPYWFGANIVEIVVQKGEIIKFDKN